MSQILFTTISSIIAVVIVFLFAIEKFSKQIQYLIGEKFKLSIEKFTSTPIKGILLGTIISSILQSSSAVSVIVISFVEANLLPFTNSLGIIMEQTLERLLQASLLLLSY